MKKSVPVGVSKIHENASRPEHITPEIAVEWLGDARKNRNISLRTVNKYVEDMKRGKWLITGDPIRFNEDGKLIDGQHRLKACIIADMGFHSYVIRGIPDSSMEVIDSGRKRVGRDILVIRGYTNATLLAAAARWLATFKRGLVRQDCRGSHTHSEMLEIIERHPGLEESCRILHNSKVFSASLIAATHYVGTYLLNKPDESDDYAIAVVRGTDDSGRFSDSSQNPALQWREKAIAIRLKGQRFSEKAMAAGTIWSYNYYVDGKPVKRGVQTPPDVSFNKLDLDKI